MNPSALVTGCGSGIGLRLAAYLNEKGFRLMLTDLEERLPRDAFPENERLILRGLDVRSEADWRDAMDAFSARFGPMDYLMNVAGYLKPGYIHKTDAGEIGKHLEVNTAGVMLGSHTAAKVMMEQGFGHIINIASLAGVAAIPGLCLYSASKFAVRGFSLAIAQELKPLGVAVTVICPDAVQTPMLDLQVDYDEAALTFSGGRVLSVDDVVRSIEKAMAKKPLEILLPGNRGLLARIASFFPWSSSLLATSLNKKGKARQKKLRVTNTQGATGDQ